ncbi:pyridine nucleotide-disulfide oxidoreductase [Thioclava sp. SK-1]|uniref:NAD(P)/FAD-dependent oxidoreductase n=1 Tax=Thioclava sp. SK-1 TaxID=1889770 RepID=UPI000825F263|nr:FAD-dependent oxidoreductase [Thioclava sp. SK-1]OCX67257.1 pyridine nucleotide-disulfide oxidoreductase [Thioclava sp. SK-1]
MSGFDYDVAIVGAGPAGLAAATELKQLGIDRVVVLERAGQAGGMPRHCGHPPFGLREFCRVLTGPSYARRLVRAARSAGVEIRTNVTVLAIAQQGGLDLATPKGTQHLRVKRIILATGAREQTRAQQLVPGLRPVGVMNTATLQSFVYLEQLKPFKNPVIVGSELVSVSALLTCLRHGMRPVALVEPEPHLRMHPALRIAVRLLRIPVYLGAQIAAIEGDKHVCGLRISIGQDDLMLACDGVVFSGRFTPEAALARVSGLGIDLGTQGPRVDMHGRSSNPHVFVAGNVIHPVETAGYCWAEGRRVAAAVARDLSHAPAPQSGLHIACGDGVSYVVPQRVSPRCEAVLNIRTQGAAEGRIVLTDAAGTELASCRVRAYSQKPLRLHVPTLPDLSPGHVLQLRLQRKGHDADPCA